jgi:1,3-beta-glucan synthase
VLLSEIISPLCLAIIFVIAYLFVNSFGGPNGQVQPGLVRIAVISLGPIVFNMALLIVLFLVSLFLGPCVSVVITAVQAIMDVLTRLPLVELVHQPIRCRHGRYRPLRCCSRFGRVL